ncbi:MAG: NAD(P)/FAD-dependent oxidoreductase [Pseudomonadota bacterium]
MEASQECDVLVIGGGPAGSTMATLLARQGRRVVIVEKEQHPRFHIGESLLPGNVELFDKLGVRDQVEKIGMPKFGIEFVPPDSDERSYVDFSEGWDPQKDSAWQVRRSELDEVLFRNAAAQGALAFENTRVRQVDFDDAGATVQTQRDDGSKATWRTRFVVDASGRDTVLATKFKSKKKNPDHNSTALFGHFRGARRLEGKREGNISICWFEHGWFWFIPLADGTTSVGAVCWAYYLKARNKPLKDYFFDTIALCPELHDRLKDATLVDDKVHATGNFAYSSTHATGNRYLMVGDAFTFIDPMFSSGVLLAMTSGQQGARAIHDALDTGKAVTSGMKRYEKDNRKRIAIYWEFIENFYKLHFAQLFFQPYNRWGMVCSINAVLAGCTSLSFAVWWRLRVFFFLAWLNQHVPVAKRIKVS